MSDSPRLRAGTLTTLMLVIVLASCAASLALHGAHENAVLTALGAVAMWMLFCVFPLSLVDRSMRLPLAFTITMLVVAAALGTFAVGAPESTGTALAAPAVALGATLAALLLLMRARRRPGWQRAPRGAIGFYAEGQENDGPER